MSTEHQVPEEQASPDIVARAKEALDKRYNKFVALSASNLCAHCGLCATSCHYYLATGRPELTPAAKVERVRSVVKSEHDWMSRLFPWWTGARELTEEELDAWYDIAFQYCTMCERCVINCPLAVDTASLMGAVRGTLTELGKAPEILVQLADASIQREESLDLFKEYLLEQYEILEGELREITGDPEACIPIEKEGAEMLYVALSGAHTVLPAARILHQAKADWTLSLFEASNYAVFLGDIPKAKRIAKRIVDEAIRLGVKEVIITECGHAYSSFFWSVPMWFGPLPFKIRSLIEVISEYVENGTIELDPSANPEPMTFHDSCNFARKGGVVEEPRTVLNAAVADFREMAPHGAENLCCGAGSGLVAIEEWRDTRLSVGKPKADQVRATGAKTVVTSCDNCRHQLTDLSEHYGLGIEVRNLAEVTADALVC
jgi:Fe-S oxidoreductase